MRQWRLIYDPPTSGIWNMAVDEAILQAVACGDAPPTLRFYDWSPPCLSLGYGQRAADVDFEAVAALGWTVVRRPTGGRAILHVDELTYSVALPGDDPLAAGDIVNSYRQISQALTAGLEQLGIHTQSEPQPEHRSGGPVCFETPSHYEITVGGRKLVGSAQVRRYGGVLQHGSLPLHGDLGRICLALRYPDAAARAAAQRQVRARALTLAEAHSGHVFSWREVADAIAEGFARVHGIQLLPAELTPAEYHQAERLAATVYGQPAFTHRRHDRLD